MAKSSRNKDSSSNEIFVDMNILEEQGFPEFITLEEYQIKYTIKENPKGWRTIIYKVFIKTRESFVN